MHGFMNVMFMSVSMTINANSYFTYKHITQAQGNVCNILFIKYY